MFTCQIYDSSSLFVVSLLRVDTREQIPLQMPRRFHNDQSILELCVTILSCVTPTQLFGINGVPAKRTQTILKEQALINHFFSIAIQSGLDNTFHSIVLRFPSVFSKHRFICFGPITDFFYFEDFFECFKGKMNEAPYFFQFHSCL